MALTLRIRAISRVSRAYLFQIALEIMRFINRYIYLATNTFCKKK